MLFHSHGGSWSWQMIICSSDAHNIFEWQISIMVDDAF